MKRSINSGEISPSDLKVRSVRGGMLTLIGQATRFLIQIATMAVLARLLAPSEFGLVAMAAAITGFVRLINDVGLSMATVQWPRLTDAQASNLFWANVAVSLVLMGSTMSLAPWVAEFYGDPSLQGITLVLSVTILFSGLSVQHVALMRRHMRFFRLNLIEVSSLVMGSALGIGSAVLGAGYWALVIMAVGISISSLIGLWLLHPWRPGWPRRGADTRRMLRFGGYIAGFNLVNYWARQGDDILIGWAHGAHSVGLYSRAYQLVNLPLSYLNGPVTGVAIPALSRLQDDPARFVAFYKNAAAVLVSIGVPIVAFLLVAAEEVVLLVFGPGWSEAVPIFLALGPAAFVGVMNFATAWVYIPFGNTRRMFHWGLIGVPLILFSFLVGLPYGPVGVALSYSVMIVLLWFASLIYCFRGTPVRLAHVLDVLWIPALSSTVAALLTGVALDGAFVGDSAVAALMVAAPLFWICYVGVQFVFPAGRKQISRLRSASRLLVNGEGDLHADQQVHADPRDQSKAG